MTRLPLIKFKAGRFNGSGNFGRSCEGVPLGGAGGVSVYGGGSTGAFSSAIVL